MAWSYELNEDGEYEPVWHEMSGDQEPYDQSEAERLGMSYEDYIALSGTGKPVLNQDGSTTDEFGNLIAGPESDSGDAPVVPGDGTIDGINVNDVASDTGINWTKLAKQFGIIGADDKYDLKKIAGLTGGALGVVGALQNNNQPTQSFSSLTTGIPKSPTWTDEQLAFGRRPMQTGSALQRVYAADMQSPVTPGQRFAEGGEVGALSQAFAGAVEGMDGGQSDLIDAKLSPGEYVIDAESVSALGDGNTQAGIAKLDQLRAELRAQKRNAPINDIPPMAQGPLSYMEA